MAARRGASTGGSCIVTIDIAHPPVPGAEAERMLDEALRQMRAAPAPRVLRIVHGYGSSGRGGSLKETARNWCYRQRARVRAVLPGEDATPFDPLAQEIARACGVTVGSDLGPPNDGMTIVWVS